MLSLLKGRVGDAAAPFIFAAVFLLVVGGALWLTPRLAKWLDEKAASRKGYYDGMLTEDPNAPPEKEDNGDGKAD